MCKIKDTGEEFPGSPLIAMKHDFTKFVFVESNPELAASLEKRIAAAAINTAASARRTWVIFMKRM